MIRRILSIGPCGHSLPLSRARGFSLVEIMMSLVLMGIGLALALPSYRDMVEKRQVTNAAEQLASFVNAAQGAAAKTNRIVTVSYWHAGENEWCVGATEGAAACDCQESDAAQLDFCAISGQPFVLNNGHTGDLEVLQQISDGTEDAAYSFDPIRGIMTNIGDGLTAELRSPSGDFRLNLMVNATGRVILCSEDASHAIPGYEICPQPTSSI